MYYVSPKDDCPHVVDVETIINEENFIKIDSINLIFINQWKIQNARIVRSKLKIGNA